MRLRIGFWTRVMQAILADQPVPEDVIAPFLEEQERLRSSDEKARQKEILGLEKKVPV